MSTQMDRELRGWMDDWQTETETAPRATPAEEIRSHVRRRQRLLIGWVTVDVIMGLGFTVFLIHRALTNPDPVEKLAMGLLALVVVAVLLFGGWNWRGGVRASAENTSAYLAIALDRSRRLKRSLQAGWAVLAAEVVIFTPWIWYQLHGAGATPTFERAVSAWGFLVAMVALGVLAMVLLQAWVQRDAGGLEDLRRELSGDDTTVNL